MKSSSTFVGAGVAVGLTMVFGIYAPVSIACGLLAAFAVER